MTKTLYIVIPCYNEEEVLKETSARLHEKMLRMIDTGLVSHNSKIMFVNDGSKDNTWKIIEQLHFNNPIFSGVNLSRNRGHQNALFAGLMTAMQLADVTISMDADLQDDIEVLDEFMQMYYDGCDIVYGVRSDREKDTIFKRLSAQGFYKIMEKLGGGNMIFNHADYRLMSKRALEGLSSFREVNLFLRGIVPLIGFKTGIVKYSRGERFAGVSKYPLKKMIAFAWDGISSFSVSPIRFIVKLGFIVFFISLLFMLYSFVRHFMGQTVPGWTMIMLSLWMLGGIQILALGIVGEYIGKIYSEVKDRPRYIIEKILNKL